MTGPFLRCDTMEGKLLQFLAQMDSSIPAPAAPAAGGSAASGDLYSSLYMPVMLGLMFAFMWFFVIRPQKKEEKRKREMLNALKKGDAVITSSGILGTVASIKEDTVIIKVGDGTRMEFLRSAIATVRNAASSDKSDSADEKEGKTPRSKKSGKS